MGTGAERARSTTVRRLTAALAVLIAAAVLAVAVPGSAQAATASSCTGRKVRTLSFPAGSVLIYRDGGVVCAVTVQKRPGVKRLVSVSVQARGLVAVRKSRMDARSSPVAKTYAGHRRVRVTAAVGSVSYRSGWFLC
ncbi:hypothetical protein PYK79_38645 [Streptomyces sp. ID05-04B]|uniref:hypothetical protein n=1 Tax=unclassified Streptomyces TaxID=2593676 RepID=UPI000D1B18C4|nr:MULTISPECIES: hypothetical protein [unclassified Streptomyces]AVV42494.1 hypothetical protein C6376_14735 [Streptomyces sp. P3]MDX5568006.1 hypothetical protein [Streptomyces sp. ID05-04B]